MSGRRLPQEVPAELPLGNDNEQSQEEELQPENEAESDQSYSSSDWDKDEDKEEEDKDKYVLVNLSDISEDLQCPICLGVIQKAKAVMECMHRFCGECIEKSIRLCKNECPVCREHYPSGCTLRDDHTYDNLISLIYTDVDSEEESLKRQTEALDRKRRARAIAVAFARRRRIIRNASEHQISNDNEVVIDNNARKELSSAAEKTEAGSTKGGETQVLRESAILHGDENIPDVNRE